MLPQKFALRNNTQSKFSIIDYFISLHTHPISPRRSKVQPNLIRNRIHFITNVFGKDKAVVLYDALRFFVARLRSALFWELR